MEAERKGFQAQIEELTKKSEVNFQLKFLEIIRSFQSSADRVKELEAQRDELLMKIDNQQRDIEDAAEKVMRIEMVEKAYKNSQEKIRQLGNEIKQLKEENEQLGKFGK